MKNHRPITEWTVAELYDEQVELQRALQKITAELLRRVNEGKKQAAKVE